MLAAERYPDIRFASTNVRQSGPDTYEVTGELTIRDRAKPVKVSVTELRGTTTAFRGTAIVRLSDFGLKPPSAALGLVGTKDEMTLMFSLAAARAPE
jgi:polyisoprenoid-binding protein YceI